MISATENDSTRAAALAAGSEENGARAALFSVISHLFFSAPTPALLQQIANSREAVGNEHAPLAVEWRNLCDAAGAADAAAVRSEFDEVFVSTGRPPVSLYASSYMAGRRRGQLLAELRDDLALIGYARVAGSSEYEDHLSALCDVMRGLVVDEAGTADGFEKQKMFFQNYLAPWYARVCEAICHAEQTAFYRPVARFANAFFTNESEYFELA